MLKKKSGWWSALILACLIPMASFAAPSEQGELWKGKADLPQFGAGVLTGLGIANGSAGLPILGALSHRILPDGFIPDITDSGWVEVALGPTFFKGGNAFFYSAHLRWDFKKDEEWTFYSLGGLAGFITDSALGGSFELFPRFGAGALWRLNPTFQLRGELSHEVVGVGIQFPI